MKTNQQSADSMEAVEDTLQLCFQKKWEFPVTTVAFAEGSREHGISQEIINEFKGKTSLLYAIGVMMSEEIAGIKNA